MAGDRERPALAAARWPAWFRPRAVVTVSASIERLAFSGRPINPASVGTDKQRPGRSKRSLRIISVCTSWNETNPRGTDHRAGLALSSSNSACRWPLGPLPRPPGARITTGRCTKLEGHPGTSAHHLLFSHHLQLCVAVGRGRVVDSPCCLSRVRPPRAHRRSRKERREKLTSRCFKTGRRPAVAHAVHPSYLPIWSPQDDHPGRA